MDAALNVDLPFFISRKFDQVAFVVEDLEESQKFFQDTLGLGPFSVWHDLATEQVNKTYRGGPGDFQFSCAYAYSGDVLIELCHHDSGSSVYKEWLDTKGAGFNHIGFELRDRDEFEEATRIFEKQGCELAMGATRPGAGTWAYFDTVKFMGCFTELYFITPERRAMFERMKAGEVVASSTVS